MPVVPSLSVHDREPVIATAAFSTVAMLAAAMPVHNDTWWHLRAGLETLQGRSPFVDHFSWTVSGGFFWNHSWLAQAIFYAVYQTGGLPLLTALCAAAVIAGWWLVWRQCRGDAVERLVLLGVALPVSTVTWSVRPQVAIVLLPVVVQLTAANRPLAVAATMALWANLHAGFALGVLVLASGVVAALLFDRTVLRARIVTAVAGIGATLLTPLGLTNWREIAASLGRSRANAIIEWLPPGFHGHYLFFWATAVLLVGLLLVRRRRLDAPYVQVSAIAACLALVSATGAMRNMPGFMMLALPPLSAMLFSPPPATTTPKPSVGSAARRRWQVVEGAVVLAVVSWLWTHPLASMDWHPLAPDARSAVAECRAPLFNTYGLGGPLIWFVPSQPVFVDSRQDPYPVSLVQEAVHVEQTGDYRDAFQARNIGCAVVPPTSPAVATLQRDGWRTLYSDAKVVVLERPEVSD